MKVQYALKDFKIVDSVYSWTLIEFEPTEYGIRIISKQNLCTNDSGRGIITEKGKMLVNPDDFPLYKYKAPKTQLQNYYRKLYGNFIVKRQHKDIHTVIRNGASVQMTYLEICHDFEVDEDNQCIFVTHGSIGIRAEVTPKEAKRILDICREKGYRPSRNLIKKAEKV